jgi:hypothetical protein
MNLNKPAARADLLIVRAPRGVTVRNGCLAALALVAAVRTPGGPGRKTATWQGVCPDDWTAPASRAGRAAGGGRRAAGGRRINALAGGSSMAQTGLMRARIAALFDGAGWFVGLALVLFAFSLIMLLGELQSPDLVLWTGHRVVGSEQGGIVYYRWHGQNYSLDAPGYGSSKAVGVYLDPGNPDHAMIDNVYNRMAVGSLIGVPFAGGVTLLALGLSRGYRSRRRQLRRDVPADGFGLGLDSEFVARRLQELRRDERNGQ